MLHGAHLYRDLLDVKLPSIFFVNELWQWLFGENYLLHTCAEALVNLLSIGLFALLLREFALPWAGGAAGFSLFYCLPFPEFNYSQHYAVPLILVACIAARRRRDLGAGAAIVLATTFWIPALLTIVPLFMLDRSVRRLRSVALGVAAASATYYISLIPQLGTNWPILPIVLWPHNVSDRGIDFDQLRQTITDSALGPTIGLLLALLLLVVRRPTTEGQRFGLWWSLVALAGAAIPPRFSEHFFLPSIAALSMAIASYGFDLAAVRARFSLLIVAGACAVVAIWQTYVETVNLRSYTSYVAHLGEAIRSYSGAGTVLWTNEYVPELYLALEATQPDSYGGIHGMGSGVQLTPGTVTRTAPEPWDRVPQLVAYGPYLAPPPDPTIALVAQNGRAAVVHQVCGGVRFGPFTFFADERIASTIVCSRPSAKG